MKHQQWLYQLGRRLNLVRRAVELNQVELVRRINRAGSDLGLGSNLTTAQKWNNYETGDNEIPTVVVTALCAATGATRDYIFEAKLTGPLADKIAALPDEEPRKLIKGGGKPLRRRQAR